MANDVTDEHVKAGGITCSAEAQPQVVGSALLRIILSILHRRSKHQHGEGCGVNQVFTNWMRKST